MKKQPIIINGQQVGKLKASWLLFKETWSYLKADSEILWIPIITTLINIFAFGILITLFIVVVLAGHISLPGDGQPTSALEWVFIFLCYVVCAFTLAISQGSISYTVYTRAHGGDATLREALKAGFARSGDFFIWAVVTSTVGVILRMIMERSRLLGAIVAFFLGVAWSVLTYFTVPAMMLDKKSTFPAIAHSGSVFRRTWGETIVSNVTLGLTFFVINLAAICSIFGLAMLAFVIKVPVGFVIVLGLMAFIIFLFCSVLLQASLEAILKTLLYIYANERTIPQNFNGELLSHVLVSETPPAAPATPTTPVAN